ncbi:MAG: hypothetical protein M1834_006347 [Cirrosporium novae-zelandiae]|nr:MAG: hypothetical protein M1834_006347 [Cirrosporium novae-zelandiae]
MKFIPAFSPYTQKPTSQTGSARGIGPNATGISLTHLIRGHFEIHTWLLLGAALQAILTFLPFTRKYVVLVVFVILGVKATKQLLMVFGLRKNIYMEGVLKGKWAPLIPNEDGSFDREAKNKTPGGGEICVVHICSRVNHPLGLLAPGFKEVGKYSTKMYLDLEARAEYYGYLGSSSYISSSDRTTLSESLEVIYFKSREHLARFAEEAAHRDGWNWWNKHNKEGKVNHISINHEVFCIPEGKWEAIYINFPPTLLGNTSHPIKDKDGKTKWANPLVDSRKGRLRTQRGRMGLSIGNDYEKYKDDPYEV